MRHGRQRRTILFCNPFCQEISGADESLIALLEALDRRRFRPLLALPAWSPYEPRYRELGVDVFHVPIYGLRRSVTGLAWVTACFPQAVRRLLQIIGRERVDLVHSNMSVVLPSGVAARLAGVPSLYHVRSTSIASPPLGCSLLVAALSTLADQVVAVSSSIAEIFWTRRFRRHLEVIHDAVHLEAFADIEPLDGERPERVVSTMGRINPRKGYEHFIAAAALIRAHRPGTRFEIIGGAADHLEVEYLARLKRQAAELGLEESLGFLGHKSDVPAAMAGCDLFVMSSLDEGFGRVVVEAMAAGRPVVGSAIGGIRELIHSGVDGALVPAADPQAIAEAVLGYLDDPLRLCAHGAAARQAVMRLGVDQHARCIESVYDRMLARRAPPQ